MTETSGQAPVTKLDFDFSFPLAELCIVRLSAIGDTCHTVPVVRSIQRNWPGTRITWIIGKTEHALLNGLENVEFAVLDKSLGLAGYRQLRKQLNGRYFPLLLNMHASLRSGIASWMPRAGVRLGFDKARARDYQWLFCNRRIPAQAQRHVMDGLFEFASAIGIDDHEPVWNIPLGEAAISTATQLVDDSSPSLVISPCTGQRFRNYRNWRIENYSAIADYAQRRYGAQVFLTGGNSDIERQYADAIVGGT